MHNCFSTADKNGRLTHLVGWDDGADFRAIGENILRVTNIEMLWAHPSDGNMSYRWYYDGAELVRGIITKVDSEAVRERIEVWGTAVKGRDIDAIKWCREYGPDLRQVYKDNVAFQKKIGIYCDTCTLRIQCYTHK